ncbi:DNA-binding transcriptional regulator, MarR family [Sphingopyxis flava]|uniref:DNA-binding transcriptional regulator, MarR family n=1 Tax=Sphingopyxis flava TaxID=1507287 RepID=A0A1T4ZTZ0_9SPHN|nr:DNA-binding transcriptional regulator, MarR family [Sphingopyxis flava]
MYPPAKMAEGEWKLAKKAQSYRHPAEFYTNPENSIGYLARVVFRSFSRLLERRTLAYDVSAGQWRFLRQLWREDGITQRELSERVGMREPTTVVALKGLEKAGFITRRKTDDDRRKTFIFLTPHAKKLELTLAPMNAEIHEIATRGMTDEEVETLQSLMRRVIDNLADETQKLAVLSDVKA